MIQKHSTIVQPVQDAKTVYTTNDHLGSPRINTDATGQVISRHDYHPFGEEIDRTSFSYGFDTIRKQFTGYERDDETGLDFAQARMYKPDHGRFASVDPITITPMRVLDPQRLNLYVYVRNSPTAFTDPNGRDIALGGSKDDQKVLRAALIEIAKTKAGQEALQAAREAISKADAYFGGLGVNKTTPTRIPGNRR